MDSLRLKITSGLLFQSRFDTLYAPTTRTFYDTPGTHPVSLDMVGADKMRGSLFSSWSSTLTPFSVMMETLYDSLA